MWLQRVKIEENFGKLECDMALSGAALAACHGGTASSSSESFSVESEAAGTDSEPETEWQLYHNMGSSTWRAERAKKRTNLLAPPAAASDSGGHAAGRRGGAGGPARRPGLVTRGVTSSRVRPRRHNTQATTVTPAAAPPGAAPGTIGDIQLASASGPAPSWCGHNCRMGRLGAMNLLNLPRTVSEPGPSCHGNVTVTDSGWRGPRRAAAAARGPESASVCQ